MDSIEAEQRYSIKALHWLIEMIEDTEWVRDNAIDKDTIRCLKKLDSVYIKKKKVAPYGTQKITYDLSDGNAGKLGYGRLFSDKTSSLERVQRKVRGTLCRDLYYDVDVKNCQPTLLWQFAKMKYDYDLLETQKYCDNRDDYLNTISDIRDDAKENILKAMFNGEIKHAILKPMQDEIQKFAVHIASLGDYADLFAVSKPANIFASYLALILQTVEKNVMKSMRTAFKIRNYSVDVLAYDGVMLRQVKGNKPTDEILAAVQKVISDETNYHIELAIKDMDYYDFPDDDDDNAVVETEISPGVKLSEFMAMKEDFEKRFFFYNVNFTIADFKEERNEIIFMTKEQSRDYFKATKYNFIPFGRGDPVPFFDIWFNRLDRRSVDYITYKETKDPAAFYMPVKFAYQKEGPINERARGFFMDLIDITCNHNDILRTYLLSYLAHLVQKPFDLPGTSLVITGAQGTGKDTLFDFIGSKVLGDQNWADYSDNGQFFDHYDTGRAGKFLSKLQEADGRYCKPNAPKLKGLITGKTMKYNPKGKPSYELPNCIRQIFTTNKENPFALEHAERRYVMFSVSPEKQGQHAYWTALNECFNEDGAGYTIGDMLLRYDISKFNPRELPPNDYANMIHDILEKSDETFLKSDIWNGEACNISHLYNIYRTFCENENLTVEATSQYGMKNLLGKYVNQKRYIKYNKGLWSRI